MNIFLNLPLKIKLLMVQIALLFVGIYLSFYTINGNRGLRHYINLQRKVEYARQQETMYHNEKEKLEYKVHLLSSDSLDLDLLDERAKAVLSLMRDNEFIVVEK